MSPKTDQNSAIDLSRVEVSQAAGAGLEMAEGPKSRGSSVAKLRGLFTAGAATLGAAAAMGQTMFLDNGLNADGEQGFNALSQGGQRIGNIFTIPSITESETLFSYTIAAGARRANGTYSGASDIFNIPSYTQEIFVENGGAFSETTPDFTTTRNTIQGRENVIGTTADGGTYFHLTFVLDSAQLNSILRANAGKRALVVLTGQGGGDNFLLNHYTSNVGQPNSLLTWANDNSISMPWDTFQNFNIEEQGTGKFNVVPEPATIAALGIGLAGLLKKRRGHKKSVAPTDSSENPPETSRLSCSRQAGRVCAPFVGVTHLPSFIAQLIRIV